MLSTKALDEYAAVRQQDRDRMLSLLAVSGDWNPDTALKARAKALGIDELAHQAEPIRVAEFEC